MSPPEFECPACGEVLAFEPPPVGESIEKTCAGCDRQLVVRIQARTDTIMPGGYTRSFEVMLSRQQQAAQCN